MDNNNKTKIVAEGDPCRRCGTRVERREHDGPRKPGQRYWFRWWFRCPNCGTLYMDERAKAWTFESAGAMQNVSDRKTR